MVELEVKIVTVVILDHIRHGRNSLLSKGTSINSLSSIIDY